MKVTRHYSLVPPHEHPTSVTHRQTHTHTDTLKNLNVQVAELASLAQLLPPCSPAVRNPAPDSSLKSCFSRGDCVRFSCCSRARLRHTLPAAPRLRLLQLLLPIASASTAAPRLRPLQLLARLRPLRLLLPDCILDSSSCPGPMFSNILRGSVNKLKYEGRASLYSLVPPHEHPTSVTHRHTHTHTHRHVKS